MEDPPNNVVYLNNAAMARFTPIVQQAGIHAICDQMSYSHEEESDTVRKIRENFASLVDADSGSDIAMMPSTGFAVTLAAKNVESQLLQTSTSSGKILVLQDQMCSAVYPWQDLCDRSGGKFALEIVPYPEKPSSWTNQILLKLQPGTSVVAVCLPPLHWSDGALIDLVAIGEACRRVEGREIPLIVDATQAVGAMPLSVKQIQPALLACSSHKWLRGPSGVSLVYIHPKLHDSWSPLDQHGRGRDLGSETWDASKDEMGPNGYPEKFYNDARKFDSGGRSNPVLLPMLKASLDTVVALDKLTLQMTLKAILQPLMDWINSTDKFYLPDSHAYHLMGIRPTQSSALTPDQIVNVCKQLQQDRRIIVAVRCGAIRISPYIDNNVLEVEALVEALNELT